MRTTKIIFAVSLLLVGTLLATLFIIGYTSSPSNSSNLFNPQNPSSTIQLTSLEIAKHDSASDCWMIINNKVYGLTSYISSHPGGAVIADGCGKEATQLFDTQGGKGTHSSTASTILASFYIGDLNQNLAVSEIQNRTAAAANATIPKPGKEKEKEDKDENEEKDD